MPMNREIKRKWIEALRSGRYRQGRECLAEIHDGQEFHCCLGVLCEVALADKSRSFNMEKLASFADLNRMLFATSSGTTDAFLPDEVMKWAGLTQTDPIVSVQDASISRSTPTLSELNDLGKLTFEQIAQIIEEQL